MTRAVLCRNGEEGAWARLRELEPPTSDASLTTTTAAAAPPPPLPTPTTTLPTATTTRVNPRVNPNRVNPNPFGLNLSVECIHTHAYRHPCIRMCVRM